MIRVILSCTDNRNTKQEVSFQNWLVSLELEHNHCTGINLELFFLIGKTVFAIRMTEQAAGSVRLRAAAPNPNLSLKSLFSTAYQSTRKKTSHFCHKRITLRLPKKKSKKNQNQ